MTDVVALYGLVSLAIVLTGFRLLDAWRSGGFAVDFDQTLLPAAKAIANGDSPYPAYGYPPLTAFMLVPFSFVPSPEVIFTALLVIALPLSLWLLNVRDWRCHVAAFAWAPVFHALQTANVTILLLLGVALCWRYRGSPTAVALSGGITVAMKGICWPLAVWAFSTGRRLSALLMTAICAGITFGLWAVLGFSGLSTYSSSVQRLEGSLWEDTYTVRALAHDLGASAGTALVLGTALALLSVGASIVAGMKRDDARSFAFAVLAMVIASPIVWLHSFVLLLAPLGVMRNRFSAIWLLPVLLWLVSGTGNGETWQTALCLGVAAAVFGAAVTAGTAADSVRARRRQPEPGYSSSKMGLSTKPSL